MEENKYFLRIECNDFGFVVEGIHKIKDTDIPIADEDYDRFFKLQSKGGQFRIKEKPTGNTLFDYVEEYTPEIIINNTPSTEDRIKALEIALLEVL